MNQPTSTSEIKGYEHPEELSQKQRFQYQAYKETGDDPYESLGNNTHSPYAVVSENLIGRPASNTCPTCEGKALYICNCEFEERMCKEGHAWYYTSTGVLVLGDPHEELLTGKEITTN